MKKTPHQHSAKVLTKFLAPEEGKFKQFFTASYNRVLVDRDLDDFSQRLVFTLARDLFDYDVNYNPLQVHFLNRKMSLLFSSLRYRPIIYSVIKTIEKFPEY